MGKSSTKMKFNTAISSARSKQRKAHFTADSSEKRIRMSASLSKDLQKKHSVRSVPIRKDDEVIVTRGTYKNREGKVTNVYRKKCAITKLKMDKDRKNLLDRKSVAKLGEKGKGKIS